VRFLSNQNKEHRLQKFSLQTLLIGSLLIGSLLTAALVPALHAQSDTAKIHVGTVNVDFDKAMINPSLWHLMGHAKMTSDDYDLYAADIKVYFVPASKAGSKPGSKAGASVLSQAVAEGGATPDSQVIAHIRRPLDSAAFEIYSDKAVYLPDSKRPGGGTITFTAHVKIITKSGFFAEPSVSTFESATVLLGAGKDYPQLETGAGHMTFTPAQ
jgi:hypothetical protein